MHKSYLHCYKIHQFNYCPLGFLHYKRCSVRFYLLLFVRVLMSYLRYLCVFMRIVVSNRYCVVWFFFVLALCVECSQFLSYACENKTCMFSSYTVMRSLLRNCIGIIMQRMHILHHQNRKMLKFNTQIFNVTNVTEHNIQ
jgi:hypothetical protein